MSLARYLVRTQEVRVDAPQESREKMKKAIDKIKLRKEKTEGKLVKIPFLWRFLVLSGSDERKDGGRLDSGQWKMVFLKDRRA